MSQVHIWINSICGYIFTNSNKAPVTNKNKGKTKYMGFTHNLSWPKTMNTGRILYQDTPRNERKRNIRNNKKSKKPH